MKLKTVICFIFFISILCGGFLIATATPATAQEASSQGDITLQDNSTYWIGTQLYRSENIQAHTYYQIVNVRTGSNAWTRESRTDGTLLIDTQYFSSGSYILKNQTSGNTIASFTLKKQTLSVTPQSATTYNTGDATVSYTIDSNREDAYDVAIVESPFTTNQLQSIYSQHTSTTKDISGGPTEEFILQDLHTSNTITAGFTDISPNTYYFTYQVVETGVETNVHITVNKKEQTTDDTSQETTPTDDESQTISTGYASVVIDDKKDATAQKITPITVQEADLSTGGFLVIYDDGQLAGTSQYLSAGNYTIIEISLQNPIKSASTVQVVPYRDTNYNRYFDENRDTPYQVNNETVSDTAQIHPALPNEGDTTDTDTTTNNDTTDTGTTTTPSNDGSTTDDTTKENATNTNETTETTNGTPPKNTTQEAPLPTIPLPVIIGGLGLVFILILLVVGRRYAVPAFREYTQQETTTTTQTNSSEENTTNTTPEPNAGTNTDETSVDNTDKIGGYTDSSSYENNSESPYEADSEVDTELDTDSSATQPEMEETGGTEDVETPPEPKEYTESTNTDSNDSTGQLSESTDDTLPDTVDEEEVSPSETNTKNTEEQNTQENTEEVTEATYTPPEKSTSSYVEEETEEETDKTQNETPDEEANSSQDSTVDGKEKGNSGDNEGENKDEDEDEDEDDPLSDF